MKDWWQRQHVFGQGWWPWLVLGALLALIVAAAVGGFAS